MLNAVELDLIQKTVDLTNDFFALETQHPADKYEFTLAMHQIQRLIMVRSTRRIHSDVFGHNPVEAARAAGLF